VTLTLLGDKLEAYRFEVVVSLENKSLFSLDDEVRDASVSFSVIDFVDLVALSTFMISLAVVPTSKSKYLPLLLVVLLLLLPQALLLEVVVVCRIAFV
jgi:hypothetical protein